MKKGIKHLLRDMKPSKKDLLKSMINVWSVKLSMKVLVHSKEKITFTFKDGMELDWNILISLRGSAIWGM